MTEQHFDMCAARLWVFREDPDDPQTIPPCEACLRAERQAGEDLR